MSFLSPPVRRRPLIGWTIGGLLITALDKRPGFYRWLQDTPWWFRQRVKRVTGIFRFTVVMNKITTPSYGRYVVDCVVKEGRDWWVYRSWEPDKARDYRLALRQVVMDHPLSAQARDNPERFVTTP